jgi:hypothetical protein
VFALPSAAPRIPVGKTHAIIEASDYQETKNVNTISNNIMPNTRFKTVTIQGVAGPALEWLAPENQACVTQHKSAGLLVEATSNTPVVSVRFTVDGRQIGVVRKGTAGLFARTWHVGGTAIGRHVLDAFATDRHGKRLSAVRTVRVCK